MTVEIQTIEADDFEALAQIDDLAMVDNGPSQVLAQYAPPGVGRSKLFAGWVKSLWETNRSTCWKVVDTDTNEIRSFAIFTTKLEPQTLTNADDDASANSEPSEVETVMGAMWSKWNDFRNREHVDAIPHGGKDSFSVPIMPSR